MNNEMKQTYLNRLNSIKIDNGEITVIKFLEETENLVSSEGIVLNNIPARCEVYATLKPTEKSDIKVVVGLPLENWNGRFLGTGNGGAAGSLVMQSVNSGVARGFATANTDLGTSPWDACIKCPERLTDFGHRATHLMTVVGKKITEAFYGKKIKYSYFLGSSTGGGQAMHEAQRYPEDYDGLVAFSPANNRVNLHQSFIWDLQCTCANPESRFSHEQIAALNNRIIERYAVASGSAEGDGFLSYPGKVDFKPDDVDDLVEGLGLNETQINVLKKLHNFPKILGTDKEIYKTLPIGCENAALSVPYFQKGFEAMLCFLQRWAFGDFDVMSYDFGQNHEQMIAIMRADLDAMNSDLSELKSKGGKLILITGSADALIPYTDGKEYYESVVDKMGGLDNVTDFFRYFHVPGLAHGSGGPGLQEAGCLLGVPCIPCDREHDALEAVIAWVEKEIAPDMLLPVALKGSENTNTVNYGDNIPTAVLNGRREIDYERPVFPYPYETEYIGGNRKDKNNFRKKLGNGNY